MADLTFSEYAPKIKQFIKDSISKENFILKEFENNIEELDQILKDDRLNLVNNDSYVVDTNVPVPFKQSNNTVANGCTATPPTNKRKRGSEVIESDNSGFQVETLKGGCKVLVLENGRSIPTNHHIEDLIEKIKPIIHKFIDVAVKLRMFIIFLIPKIEDGNNFGVQIQDDVLSEVKAIESDAVSYFDSFSRYYLSRAKAVSKVAKYPHIDDYRKYVKELDQRCLVNIRLQIIEMKNQYASTYDLLMKNKDKIKQPKHDNSSSMF